MYGEKKQKEEDKYKVLIFSHVCESLPQSMSSKHCHSLGYHAPAVVCVGEKRELIGGEERGRHLRKGEEEFKKEEKDRYRKISEQTEFNKFSSFRVQCSVLTRITLTHFSAVTWSDKIRSYDK